MAMTPSEASQRGADAGGEGARISEVLDRLSRFDGPPNEFLERLLAAQCHLARAAGGAILRTAGEGKTSVIAAYPRLPEEQTAPAWLASAVEWTSQILEEATTAAIPLHGTEDLYGQPVSRHLVLIPVHGERGLRGLAAFVLDSGDPRMVTAAVERLELTVSLLSLYEMRLSLHRRQQDLQRLRTGMETLAALNEHDRFSGASMALCNELCSRWGCERASLGLLSGRYVKLRAMSNTEKFSRKMEIVQHLEATMEECLDQDLEIVHPAGAEATYVYRAAADLAVRGGAPHVLSVPIRRKGQTFAVLTLERGGDKPFTPEEVETLRLTCDLCAVRVANLNEFGRWFGARMAAGAKKSLAVMVGPKHTWAKLLAIGVLAAALFLTFVHGDDLAQGTFVLHATRERTVPAPFEGYLKTVAVEPGDRVRAGDVLATLDTSDLTEQLAQSQSRRAEAKTKRANAMNAGKTAEAQIAEAEMQGADAQIRRIQRHIRDASITAPIDGVIVKGDLKRQIDAVLEKGQALFEISPMQRLWAEVAIPEDQIAGVREKGQKGRLATTAFPDQRIEFLVERVNPIAEVVEQQNVFNVRVQLLDVDPDLQLRPGMEGLAKITLGRKPYGVLWTRRLVNWIRMKLWW